MPTSEPEENMRRRRFPLWVGLALSVATVGPTIAMAGNGQGLVSTVGKAVPLVFVIGLVGVLLVGYSFVRLTRHLNHAGSAYALVGVTVGPRTGFFSGFAMLGAYIAFSIGTLALTATFTNAFLAELDRRSKDPFQLPWLVPILVAGALSLLLTGRDTRALAKILLAIEGLGIAAMVVLSGVILYRGGSPSTGVDLSVFTPSGVSVADVLGGVVAAFLCWAGFEACVSMGEETEDPQRNIPRALIGTLVLTGILFVVVMFAQTIGFGTDAAGLKAFANAENSLGALAQRYIGEPFSLLISFTAVVGAFGCHMATATTSGRLLYAFSRDGFGPKFLNHIDSGTRSPQRASWSVVLVAIVVSAVSGPTLALGGSAGSSTSTYFVFGIAGSVCLMVCYLLVEVATVWFTVTPRFASLHPGESRAAGVVLPTAGVVFIAVVLWFSVKDAGGWRDPPIFGLYWCAVGAVIALAASARARRIGQSLADEVGIRGSTVSPPG